MFPETGECTMFICQNGPYENNSWRWCICQDKVIIDVGSNRHMCCLTLNARVNYWNVSNNKTRMLFSVPGMMLWSLTFSCRRRHHKSLYKSVTFIYGFYTCDNETVNFISLQNIKLIWEHSPLSTFYFDIYQLPNCLDWYNHLTSFSGGNAMNNG